MTDTPLIVLFAERPDRRAIGLRRWMRLISRRPLFAYSQFLRWTIATLSRSNIVHVAVAYDGAVLDPRFRGNLYWSYIAYVLAAPFLTCAYELHGDPVDLDRHKMESRKPIIPTVLRWITRGRLPKRGTDDCVCVVLRVLAEAGIAAPPHIVSPQQLHDWMEGQGFRHVRFDD